MKIFLGVMVALFCTAECHTRKNRHPVGKADTVDMENRINLLLADMTIEEKLGQLFQAEGFKDDGSGEIQQRLLEMARKGLLGSVLNVYGAKRVNKILTASLESRHKIPVLVGFDVIHGFRTLFPIPLGEAASWDLEAAERAATIAAAEARAAGVHWTFAPMVDVSRDPRWGRVMEGAGEDVFLNVEMAKARVRGFQGTDYSRPDRVLACAKHFLGYGAVEAGRDYNTVDMSERRLRETYLPSFKAAVDAGVDSFMTSFNDLNGVPATGNSYLLKQILRDEWKFDGMVISDYNSVVELINHGMAANASEAAMYALNAGTDMEMFSTAYTDHGANLVQNGKVRIETINEAVRNVLRIKFRLGLFDEPFPFASEALEAETIFKPEFRRAAQEIAAKSFVLLKNERQILPINRQGLREVAVIGALADDKPNTLDWWPGDAKAEDSITILQGLQDKLGTTVNVTFAKGCEAGYHCTSTEGFAAAVALAEAADFTVLVVGETRDVSGEGASLANINLSGLQLDLVKAIHDTRKPYVVVLKNGRPMTIEWLAENSPAILVTWHSGTMGGPAVADVLLGDVNPSGKLPMTFPRNLGQVPLAYDFKNTGRPFIVESERFTSRYFDSSNSPLYSFGFGLSYTTFSIRDLKLSAERIKADESINVTVLVENTGLRDGEEVVQLYVRDVAARITRPMRQLKGFKKILLKAGQQQLVEFVLTANELGYLDEAWKLFVEAGEFEVYVGNSCEADLTGRFVVEELPLPETTVATPATSTTSDVSSTSPNSFVGFLSLAVFACICY